MRSSLLTLFVVASCLALVDGHICMFSPLQRGSMVLDQPGDPSCSHKGPAPCGGVAQGQTTTTLTAGSTFEVNFQQNLNHFYHQAPGHLLVQIAKGPNPVESDFSYLFGQAIPDFNAMDEINYANMTITGTLPSTPCAQCVMRLTYGSNNPLENDTSTNFYQCADITLVQGDELIADEELMHKPIAPTKIAASPTDCCTITQWEGYFNTASSFAPQVGNGMISYDAINHFLFAMVPSGADSEPHYHFSNFTSGIEWNFDQSTGKCSEYGLDLWNNWCYGSDQNEVAGSPIVIGGATANTYSNANADFAWAASQGTCQPVLRHRDSTSETTFYYNITAGIANPHVFVPPAACRAGKGWQLSQTASVDEIAEYAAQLPRRRTEHKAHATMLPTKKHHASQPAGHDLDPYAAIIKRATHNIRHNKH